MTQPAILDPCCGTRMFWFDRQNPLALFGDIRREIHTVTDRSHGNASGKRVLEIAPDMQMDFRELPFPDRAFKLVIFDPPHLNHAGKGWLAAKYGVLGSDWREDLRRGFSECFRVLDAGGTLVFKWSETNIPLRDVLALTEEKPLIGNKRPKENGTHWLVFFKESA